MIKDCHERKSFPDQDDANRFRRWYRAESGFVVTVFECQRCHRWHIAATPGKAEAAQKVLAETGRCVTDRELHLQMARLTGCSLDELQTRIDLTKIHIAGPGVEVVTVRPEKKPWD